MALSGLDCHKCRDKTGCEEDAPDPVFDMDGEMLHRCPVRLITPESMEMMGLYGECKAFRCLPFPGALLEQPARVMKAFRVIESAVALHHKEALDKQRRR